MPKSPINRFYTSAKWQWIAIYLILGLWIIDMLIIFVSRPFMAPSDYSWPANTLYYVKTMGLVTLGFAVISFVVGMVFTFIPVGDLKQDQRLVPSLLLGVLLTLVLTNLYVLVTTLG